MPPDVPVKESELSAALGAAEPPEKATPAVPNTFPCGLHLVLVTTSEGLGWNASILFWAIKGTRHLS